MEALTALATLDGRYRWLREPGYWFWLVLFAGAALRAFLVLFTEGTYDALVWEALMRQVAERGVVSVYLNSEYVLNHPPFISAVMADAWSFGQATGVPFAALLRAPFVAFDAGCVWLLIRMLSNRPERYVVAALYWLHPLALVYSSYHGNTDTAIACMLLASALLVSRRRPLLAGAVLGLSFWIKLPGAFAGPALVLALPSWGERVRFAAAAAGVGIASYLPSLIENPRAVVESVLLYGGLKIRTTGGIHVWGVQNFYGYLGIPVGGFAVLYDRFNSLLCVFLVLIMSWCRRGLHAPREVSWSVASSYAVLYGLTNFWSFQYFAWSLPFWLLSGWRFALSASLLSTAYVFGLYAWLTGGPTLVGSWDFIGHPQWPAALLVARDLATLFFLGAAIYAVASAVRRRGS